MTKAIVLALVLVAQTASADDSADTLFKRGKKLLAEKKYADACAAFEKSNKLDPGIGALLNVARCYEEWGKLATAYRHYKEAERMASEAKDNRTSKIHERVEKVEPLVPKLTVRAPKDADTDGVSLTIDGVAADLGDVQLVDPGPHLIEYKAAGAKKSKVVPVERGASSEIAIDLPKSGKPDKPDRPEGDKPDGDKVAPPIVKPVESDPGSGRRLGGMVLGGAGIVGIGVGGYLALSARSTYNQAITDHCGGSKSMCDPDGLSITHDARSKANIATIVFAVGAAATAAGVVLYVTAPRAMKTEHALRLTPAVGNGAAALILDGSF
jgi:serine/threonine-protein kinase